MEKEKYLKDFVNDDMEDEIEEFENTKKSVVVKKRDGLIEKVIMKEYIIEDGRKLLYD